MGAGLGGGGGGLERRPQGGPAHGGHTRHCTEERSAKSESVLFEPIITTGTLQGGFLTYPPKFV